MHVFAILFSVHEMLMDSEKMQKIAYIVNLNHQSLLSYCNWGKTYGIFFLLSLSQLNCKNVIVSMNCCYLLSVNNGMHIWYAGRLERSNS